MAATSTGRVVGPRAMRTLPPAFLPDPSSSTSIDSQHRSNLQNLPKRPRQEIVTPSGESRDRIIGRRKKEEITTCSSGLLETDPTIVERRQLDVIAHPPQESASPQLLLEGDEFYLSPDGVSRTYYELTSSSGAEAELSEAPFAVEEEYDIKNASKTFTVRRASPGKERFDQCGAEAHSTESETKTALGRTLFPCVELQEIEHGVLSGAGTGSTTWESSIVMAMFFSSHPQFLRGDIIELGSGVGLGGILTDLLMPSAMRSMTLTDCNLDVLKQCQRNIHRAHRFRTRRESSCSVAELDWYDFINNTPTTSQFSRQYDTVVACDCAYLHTDLVALSRTMTGLLRPNGRSLIHVFGPSNRAALHELITHLRCQTNLKIDVEEIVMNRYRLKPKNREVKHPYAASGFDKSCIASKKIARFVHMTASLDSKETNRSMRTSSIQDID